MRAFGPSSRHRPKGGVICALILTGLNAGLLGCGTSGDDSAGETEAQPEKAADKTGKPALDEVKLDEEQLAAQVEGAGEAHRTGALRGPDELPTCSPDDWKVFVLPEANHMGPATIDQMCDALADAGETALEEDSGCSDTLADGAICKAAFNSVYDRCSCYIDNLLECIGDAPEYECSQGDGLFVPTSGGYTVADDAGGVAGLSLRYCQSPWLNAYQCVYYVWLVENEGKLD